MLSSKLNRFLPVAAIAAALSVAGAVQADETGKTGKAQDSVQKQQKCLLEKLHAKNQKEIALGEIALKKAQLSETKELAKMLVDHHRKADQKILDFAKKQNIQLDETT